MTTAYEQQRSFLNGLSTTVRIPPPVDVSHLHPDTNSLDVMVKLEVLQMPFSTRADWRICWTVVPKARKTELKDQTLTCQLKLFQNIDQHGNVSYINWGAVIKNVDRSIAYALTFDIDSLDLTRRDKLCQIAYETSVLKSMDANGPRRRPREWVQTVLKSAVAEGILSSEKVDVVLNAVRRSNLL